MANRYSNPHTGMGTDHRMETGEAPIKSSRFTAGAETRSPTHNPKQPHLGLPIAPHTHVEAAKAVNVHFNANGKPSGLPAPSPTPRSEANKTNIRANVKKDFDAVEVTNAPKGHVGVRPQRMKK